MGNDSVVVKVTNGFKQITLPSFFNPDILFVSMFLLHGYYDQQTWLKILQGYNITVASTLLQNGKSLPSFLEVTVGIMLCILS